ncbi:unnamed protein product [Urochloa humidicola]
MAAALAIFGQMMLVHDDAGLANAHRHRRLPLRHRHRLLRYSAACIVLGASVLFHAVAGDPNDNLALAGFLLWVGGLALLLLFHGSALPHSVTSCGSASGGSGRGLLLAGTQYC